jgi:hypothetical protein
VERLRAQEAAASSSRSSITGPPQAAHSSPEGTNVSALFQITFNQY